MSDVMPTQFCDDHCCNALCGIACAIDDCLAHLDENCDTDGKKQCCQTVLDHLLAANEAAIATIREKLGK